MAQANGFVLASHTQVAGRIGGDTILNSSRVRFPGGS